MDLLDGLEFEIENFGDIYDEFNGKEQYKLVNKRLDAYKLIGITKDNYEDEGISLMEDALSKYNKDDKIKASLITLGIRENEYPEIIKIIEKEKKK